MPTNKRKPIKTLVFGEPDRPANLYRVRAGDRKFLLLVGNTLDAAIVAFQHVGATSSEDIAKPFEMETIRAYGEDHVEHPWPHARIGADYLGEIVVVLK